MPIPKGSRQSPEWIAARAAALRGRKLSPECREKISRAMKGRTGWNKGLRKATSALLSKSGHVGEKHWNWKGGISDPKNRLRQSSEYFAWRDAVFRRDNWTCQGCDKRGGILRAHHLILFSVVLRLPEEMKKELLWAVENGMTVCDPCHKEIHRE